MSARLQTVLEAGRAHRAKAKTGSMYSAHHAERNQERDDELLRERFRRMGGGPTSGQDNPFANLRVTTAESHAPGASMTVILEGLTQTPGIPPGRYTLTRELVEFLANSPSHIVNYKLNVLVPHDPHFTVNETRDRQEWQRLHGPAVPQRDATESLSTGRGGRGTMPQSDPGYDSADDLYS
tara:strand:+ start:446 stop:988 length:543 start_codon:yes stop_codon:yes gene_type:complete